MTKNINDEFVVEYLYLEEYEYIQANKEKQKEEPRGYIILDILGEEDNG